MIDWLVTNALAALVLAAIAGVLIWTFRPAPAVRHALWLVVVLKLVSPGVPAGAIDRSGWIVGHTQLTLPMSVLPEFGSGPSSTTP